MFAREPHRRRRGGRAQNHFHAVLRRQRDILLQPVELVLALLWLHEGPREVAHVDELHAKLAHVGHVARPLIFGPGFGIVVDADLMTIGVYYYPEAWPENQWARGNQSGAAAGVRQG